MLSHYRLIEKTGEDERFPGLGYVPDGRFVFVQRSEKENNPRRQARKEES